MNPAQRAAIDAFMARAKDGKTNEYLALKMVTLRHNKAHEGKFEGGEGRGREVAERGGQDAGGGLARPKAVVAKRVDFC